ncbi:hypothetical protein V8G54_031690 [Vigna mungo]|uniref:Uncharacterized protein n=1 Tax=Vigna mungo TaxID=3915 RepID=A0AAQ3MK88_VIGMU
MESCCKIFFCSVQLTTLHLYSFLTLSSNSTGRRAGQKREDSEIQVKSEVTAAKQKGKKSAREVWLRFGFGFALLAYSKLYETARSSLKRRRFAQHGSEASPSARGAGIQARISSFLPRRSHRALAGVCLRVSRCFVS